MPAPVLLRHPSSSTTTRGRIRSSRRASSRSSARSTARPGARLGAARLLRRPARGARDDASAASTWASSSSSAAAGGGQIDPTRPSAPGPGRRRATAWVARARRRLLLGGDGPAAAASAHRPPGHHAERDRAMGFCLFDNIAIAARRALDVHGLERVLIARLGRPPRQRDERHLPRHRRGAVRVDPRVPAVPGDRAGDATSGSGRGRGLHGEHARSRRVGGRDVVLARRARGAADRTRLRPRADPRVGGVRRARRRPAGGLQGDRAGFAAMAASARSLAEERRRAAGDRPRGRLRARLARAVLRGTLEVVGGATAPAAPDVPVHPLATEALARLVARWPALSGL